MKSILVFITFFWCILSFNIANATEQLADDNEKINQLYTMFIKAYEQLDATLLTSFYAEDAIHIPEDKNRTLTQGKDNIIALYQKFFDKLKNENAKISVDFRLVKRVIKNDTVADVSYYIVHYHPPAASGEPTTEFAGKAVFTAYKDEQQNWRVYLDVNNKALPAHYFDVTPQPALYYGTNLQPIVNEQNSEAATPAMSEEEQ